MATRKSVKKKVAKKKVSPTERNRVNRRRELKNDIESDAPGPVVGKENVRRKTKEDRKVRSG